MVPHRIPVLLAVGAVLLVAGLAVLLAPTEITTTPLPLPGPGAGPADPGRVGRAAATVPFPAGEGRAPERQLAAPERSEQPLAPDFEWLRLPKSRRDVLFSLVSAPQNANGTLLLRNTILNPRDVFLPPDCRNAVAATVAESRVTVQALAGELAAAHEREFAGLHASGLTTEVDLAVYEGALPLQRVGPDPALRVLDGRTYGVSKSRMPETRRAEQRLCEAGDALVARLVEVFAAAGALTAEERLAILTRSRAMAGKQP